MLNFYRLAPAVKKAGLGALVFCIQRWFARGVKPGAFIEAFWKNIMQHKQEIYISLLGATVVCAGLFLLASTMAFIDLGDFRQKVEKLFQVDFSAVTTFTSGSSQQEATSLAGEMAMGQSESLFARAPQMPELPQVGFDKFPASSMQPPELPAQPPLGLSPEDSGLSAIAGSTLPGIGEGGDDVIALRRKVVSADKAGAALIGDALSGHGGSVERIRPKPEILDFKPGVSEGPLPEVAVGAVQPQLTGGNFTLPSEVNLQVQDLVKYRPEEGYPSLDSEISSRFFLEKRGGENYFSVEFSLRPESKLPVLSKDVAFLIDVSQSISTAQIQAARSAVLAYLSSLRSGDRWNVYIFSERTYSFTRDYSFRSADAFDEEAVSRFIKRPANEFMTDLFDATSVILRRIPGSSRPCNIFLISDGKANYSTNDVRRIVQGFSRQRRDNFSIFTFMSGDKGDADLLRLLAYRSRGFFARHNPGLNLSNDLLTFFTRYDQPVLSNCVGSYTNLEPDSVFPQVLPNLYRNTPVVFTGSSQEPGSFVIRVMGVSASGGVREFYFRPEGSQVYGGQSIYREWALGRAYDMVQKIIDAQDRSEFNLRLQELRRLINNYGLTFMDAMAEKLGKSR